MFDLFRQTVSDCLKCVGRRVKQVCGKIRSLNQRSIFQRIHPWFSGRCSFLTDDSAVGGSFCLDFLIVSELFSERKHIESKYRTFQWVCGKDGEEFFNHFPELFQRAVEHIHAHFQGCDRPVCTGNDPFSDRRFHRCTAAESQIADVDSKFPGNDSRICFIPQLTICTLCNGGTVR